MGKNDVTKYAGENDKGRERVLKSTYFSADCYS